MSLLINYNIDIKHVEMFREIYNQNTNESIYLVIACNALFVVNDIRPAYLFSYHYFANSYEDLQNITPLKLKEQRVINILKNYLTVTETSYGIFVTKEKIPVITISKLEQLIVNKYKIELDNLVGKLLGYPIEFIGDLNYINKRKYVYRIYVKDTLAQKHNCLFSVICHKDIDIWFEFKTQDMQKVLNELKKINSILNIDTYFTKQPITFHPYVCKL